MGLMRKVMVWLLMDDVKLSQIRFCSCSCRRAVGGRCTALKGFREGKRWREGRSCLADAPVLPLAPLGAGVQCIRQTD